MANNAPNVKISFDYKGTSRLRIEECQQINQITNHLIGETPLADNKKEFSRNFPIFQDKWIPKGFNVLWHTDAYAVLTMNQFIQQLIAGKKVLSDNNANIRILPSWVRYFKSKDIKFVRLTFQIFKYVNGTIKPEPDISKIELNFDTMINGMTFVMSKQEYKRCKNVIHRIIPLSDEE